MILVNSFSINMLEENRDVALSFRRVSLESIAMQTLISAKAGTLVNCIGHRNSNALTCIEMAKAEPELLNLWPANQRTTVRFNHHIYVCSYKGPRLKENALELPKEGRINFWEVTLVDDL